MIPRAFRSPPRMVRQPVAARVRPSGGGLPYSLPAAGQVALIGANDAMDVIPTAESWTEAAWDYSLFGSYGGGVLSTHYSTHGAYCITGGGHGHPDNHGVGGFDFSTDLWFRLDNANGVPRLSADPFRYLESQTTGAEHYEVTGSQVPAPPHPYAKLIALPGGTRGRIAYFTRDAICSESRNSTSSHDFDLATRLWARITTSGTVETEPECDAVLDTTRNVVWMPHVSPSNYSKVRYLDLADNTYKTTAETGSFFPGALTGYYRNWMHDGLLMRNCGASGLWYFDPSDTTPTWAQCTVSGTLPHVTNRPARHSDGRYYSFRGVSASSTVDRLTAPGNPKTGTWECDTVTLGGSQLPAKTQGTEHYTRLFYVPSIDCLSWIAGGSNRVAIFKPPA